ncbi:MAG: hypothetical protein JNL89_16695 [Rhodanobacteraceae bacterium]|nr:hypothetical protein [Rhodanobacteraceae bacterium]
MAHSSKIVLLAGGVAVLTGALWLSYLSPAPQDGYLLTADGERYSTLVPSEQGALAACTVCHRISAHGVESSAPSLWGIVGARKAGAAWFGYSPALAAATGHWTAEEIDRYLADPVAYLPGTSKTLSQVRDADERKRIIAALQKLSP